MNKDTRVTSTSCAPVVEEAVALGLVPELVRHLRAPHAAQQTQEALAILTAITFSRVNRHVHAVADAQDCLFRIVEALGGAEGDAAAAAVRTQALSVLGNLAGHDAHCRDAVLRWGALPRVLRLLPMAVESGDAEGANTAAFFLQNCLRTAPMPPKDVRLEIVHALVQLTLSCGDEEDDDDEGGGEGGLGFFSVDALWGLHFGTKAADDAAMMQPLFEAEGLVARLVDLLDHPSLALLSPAVHILSNLAACDGERPTQAIIDAGGLEALHRIIAASTSPRAASIVRKEACFALSNIVAGTASQRAAALAEPGLVATLMEIMMNEAEGGDAPAVCHEACWAITNAAIRGTQAEAMGLVRRGALGALFITLREEWATVTVLKGVEALLVACRRYFGKNGEGRKSKLHATAAAAAAAANEDWTHPDSVLFEELTVLQGHLAACGFPPQKAPSAAEKVEDILRSVSSGKGGGSSGSAGAPPTFPLAPPPSDLTMEEKSALVGAMDKLKTDEVERVLAIVTERGAALNSNDQKVELDIDDLDTGTLRELQRYIASCLGTPEPPAAAQYFSSRDKSAGAGGGGFNAHLAQQQVSLAQTSAAASAAPRNLVHLATRKGTARAKKISTLIEQLFEDIKFGADNLPGGAKYIAEEEEEEEGAEEEEYPNRMTSLELIDPKPLAGSPTLPVATPAVKAEEEDGAEEDDDGMPRLIPIA